MVRAHTIRDACTPPSHPDADGGRGRFTLPLTAPLTQVTGRLASNKSASSRRTVTARASVHRTNPMQQPNISALEELVLREHREKVQSSYALSRRNR